MSQVSDEDIAASIMEPLTMIWFVRISALGLALLCVVPCQAQSPDASALALRTPDEIAQWVADAFRYEMRIPDTPKPVDEVLRTRCGDCDDLAFATAALLGRINVEARVVCVTFAGVPVGHALCAWVNRAGTYNFLSSHVVRHTRQRSIPALVEAYYGEWERIIVMDADRKIIRVISRQGGR